MVNDAKVPVQFCQYIDKVEMADKRADYFQAGSQVVWDVDPVAKAADTT